jgi:precorrin-6A/cobalt-precorrin-6A reductase
MAERRLLILGGTGDAIALAARAAELPGLTVVSSLAGRTRNPRAPEGDLRVGGFGGPDGLAEYLRDSEIGLVIDATHPFAIQITANAIAACDGAARPLLALRRPEWLREAGDRWVEVDTVADAAEVVGDQGRRAFVTVGRGEIGPFEGRADLWFLVRLMEVGDGSLDISDGEIVIARGPFEIEGEKRLMRDHRIDCLVTKNAGGDATYAKIAAARAIGLPVVMVRRPPLPDIEGVETIDAAINWLEARLD